MATRTTATAAAIDTAHDQRTIMQAASTSPTFVASSAPSTSSNQDADLFSFLSNMHLSSAGVAGSPSSNVAAAMAAAAAAAQVQLGRKRKFLDQGVHGAGGSQGAGLAGSKLNSMRPPFLRRGSSDVVEDHVSAVALHTPQCSQTGFADEEDRINTSNGDDNDHVAAAEQARAFGRARTTSEQHNQMISDIADNLAANFDDSLSGLGVDIGTTSYGMSEALLALPNLSISNFKQEIHSPPHPNNRLKEEPMSRSGSTGRNGVGNNTSSGHNSGTFCALDLTSDEAHLPDGNDDGGKTLNGPRSFAGSVAGDGGSRVGTPYLPKRIVSMEERQSLGFSGSPATPERYGSNPNLSDHKSNAMKSKSVESRSPMVGRTHKVILPLQSTPGGSGAASPTVAGLTLAGNGTPPPNVMAGLPGSSSSSSGSGTDRFDRLNEPCMADELNRFQYILAAPTSIATKISEPSITYLNQGQAYELRIKKLGNLSVCRKLMLRCVMRICFHERRLQYMEAEQINDWRNSHPGERILDIDLPLSYGVIEPLRDPAQLNVISFKWDPTRDTGVFIKVNCISTEFTPKKHGGEKGVPFRLQVETFDLTEDLRLHAGGCIMQVFKLKGADRKHKQDRDKIGKRPVSEQEKYAPSYDCTILSDLSVENIYVPAVNMTSASPPTPSVLTAAMSGTLGGPSSLVALDSPTMSVETSPRSSRQEDVDAVTAAIMSANVNMGGVGPPAVASPPLPRNNLPLNASVDMVTQWLALNRYGKFATIFRNYNGRDMLRLMREEVIALCGLSEGIRMYNDMHMAVVAPRVTFYAAQKHSAEYNALFLEDMTVNELLLRLSLALNVDQSVFAKVFIAGPHGILIRVTDEVVRFTKPDTVFHFTLRQNEANSDTCDIILESSSPLMMSDAEAAAHAAHADHSSGLQDDQQQHSSKDS